jgi:hypothetical protein
MLAHHKKYSRLMVRVSSVVTNAVNIDSKPAPEEKKKSKEGKK